MSLVKRLKWVNKLISLPWRVHFTSASKIIIDTRIYIGYIHMDEKRAKRRDDRLLRSDKIRDFLRKSDTWIMRHDGSIKYVRTYDMMIMDAIQTWKIIKTYFIYSLDNIYAKITKNKSTYYVLKFTQHSSSEGRELTLREISDDLKHFEPWIR
jgi:hypothetical protein